MVIINIIAIIINFKTKQISIAIIGIIISLILCFTYWEHNRIQVFIIIIGTSISLIASVINLFLSFNLEQTNNSKVPFITFCIFNVIILFIILTPIIMNYINIKNMKKIISNIDNSCIETYISEQENEYIFYNKKGKEINRVNKDLYGRIHTIIPVQNSNKTKLKAFIVTVNGTRIILGITERGIIINEKGEKLMKLCNMFDDNFSVYMSFIRVLSVKKIVVNERYVLNKDKEILKLCYEFEDLNLNLLIKC